MQMSADYFPAIGISTVAPGYGIVKNSMDNVPSKLLNSWQYPTPAPVNTFTFFFK
jgi:peptide/nickel transport system substrate-binding protein